MSCLKIWIVQHSSNPSSDSAWAQEAWAHARAEYLDQGSGGAEHWLVKNMPLDNGYLLDDTELMKNAREAAQKISAMVRDISDHRSIDDLKAEYPQLFQRAKLYWTSH